MEEWFDLGLSSRLLPQMRTLEIRRTAIPPPVFFTTLRELTINVENMDNPPLRVEDVVDILAHSPRSQARFVAYMGLPARFAGSRRR